MTDWGIDQQDRARDLDRIRRMAMIGMALSCLGVALGAISFVLFVLSGGSV